MGGALYSAKAYLFGHSVIPARRARITVCPWVSLVGRIMDTSGKGSCYYNFIPDNASANAVLMGSSFCFFRYF